MPDRLFPIFRKEIRHHTTGQGGGPVIKEAILRCIGDLFAGKFRMHEITIDELTRARQPAPN